MKILALDLATHTGIALGRPGADPLLMSLTIPSYKEMGRRWNFYYEWLDHRLTQGDITHVAVEAPAKFQSSVQAATIARSLNSFTDLLCYRHKIPLFPHNIGTIKKFMTGSGRARKADMTRAVRQRGLHPTNDNESDAAAVWLLTVHKLCPDQHQTLFEAGMKGTP